MPYTFRFRFQLERSSISSPEHRLELCPRATTHGPVELLSRDPGGSISDAVQLILRVEEFPSEDMAHREGARFVTALSLALLRHRLGVRPARTVPKGVFFQGGLKMLEEATGHRVINDNYGAMVFESDPQPKFVATGGASVRSGTSSDRFCSTYAALRDTQLSLDARDQLAIDLFNTSFLEPSAHTRLLTLVMAIEALLEPPLREGAAVALVDDFLRRTQESQLKKSDRDSLVGSLRWLRHESISATGRSLARSRLAGRQYDGMEADKFFTRCYTLRSALVHGAAKQPNEQDVSICAANLELFVSDLITSKFISLSLLQ